MGTWTLAISALVAGCYKPEIADGGLACARADEKRCPDGFVCDTAANRCRRTLPSDGGTVDRPADRPVDVPLADVPVDRQCVQPIPNCTPSGTEERCDPVCQTGCACAEQCSVNATGALTCNVPLVGGFALGKSCDISAAGTAMQTDNCAPGLVCLEGCGSRCFRHCRLDADCVNATCSRLIPGGGGRKACEVSFSTCNPMLTGTAAGCGASSQACYLSTLQPDKTFCDCPQKAVPANGACESPQDCVPGLVCVDATNSMDFRCRRVCNLSAPGGGGCAGGTCLPIKNSNTYGFCN